MPFDGKLILLVFEHESIRKVSTIDTFQNIPILPLIAIAMRFLGYLLVLKPRRESPCLTSGADMKRFQHKPLR